jgi:hypothetical protein
MVTETTLDGIVRPNPYQASPDGAITDEVQLAEAFDLSDPDEWSLLAAFVARGLDLSADWGVPEVTIGTGRAYLFVRSGANLALDVDSSVTVGLNSGQNYVYVAGDVDVDPYVRVSSTKRPPDDPSLLIAEPNSNDEQVNPVNRGPLSSIVDTGSDYSPVFQDSSTDVATAPDAINLAKNLSASLSGGTLTVDAEHPDPQRVPAHVDEQSVPAGGESPDPIRDYIPAGKKLTVYRLGVQPASGTSIDGLEAVIRAEDTGQDISIATGRSARADPLATYDGDESVRIFVRNTGSSSKPAGASVEYEIGGYAPLPSYIVGGMPRHFGEGSTAIFNDFLGQSDDSVRAVSVDDGGEIGKYTISNEDDNIVISIDEPADTVVASTHSTNEPTYLLDVSDPLNITEIRSFTLTGFNNTHCIDPSSDTIWAWDGVDELMREFDYFGNQGTTFGVSAATSPTFPQLEYDTTTSTLFFLHGQENKLIAFDDAGNQKWSTTAVDEHGIITGSQSINLNNVRKFCVNNGAAVAVDSGTLKQWDAETGTVEWTAPEPGKGWCVSVSDRDGLVAVTHPGSSTAQFYDSDGKTRGSISLPSDAYLCAIVDRSSARYLYVALDDQTERVYEFA